MDIRAKIADLHHDLRLRLVDIHPQMRIRGEQAAAYLCRDLGRGQRKALVAAAGIHLKGFHPHQRILQILDRCRFDRVHILFDHPRAGERRQAEHARHAIRHFVPIDVLLRRFDIDGGLRLADGEFADRHEAAAQIFDQHRFKGVAVQPFQRELAVFYQ